MKKNKVIKIITIIFIIIVVVILISLLSETKKVTKDGNKMFDKQAQAQSYDVSSKLQLQDNDRIIGSKKAGLKVFVYEDYSNKYSAEFVNTLDKVFKDQRTKIAIIVRPFIGTSSLKSQQTALAMRCAGNKWEDMRKALFIAVEDNNLNIDDLSIYAKKIKINVDKFNNCLQDPKQLTYLNEQINKLKEENILGAPTTFVGDELILGARPYKNYVDNDGNLVEGLSTVIARKLQ